MAEQQAKNAYWTWLNPLIPFAGGAAVGIALRLIFTWDYDEAFNAMTGAFVYLVPVVVGVVTVSLAYREKPRSLRYCFSAAAVANALFILGTFTILIEGLICVILAGPLFAGFGGVAGLLTGLVFKWRDPRRPGMYSIVALPLLVAPLEQPLPLTDTIHTVKHSTVIAAPAEKIWPHLLSTPRIEPNELDDAWMYRIGVPLPHSAKTTQADEKLVREIEMGRGIRFSLVSDDWQDGKFIHWRFVFTEKSVPKRALDDHVTIGGPHFDLIDARYAMEPVQGGTRLSVAMRYRVSTRFNWYANWVAATLVRNFEEHALAFYAQRALSGEIGH